MSSARRSGDDAEQRADRELEASGGPGLELFPGPVVRTDLAPASALAASDEPLAVGGAMIAYPERSGPRSTCGWRPVGFEHYADRAAHLTAAIAASDERGAARSIAGYAITPLYDAGVPAVP